MCFDSSKNMTMLSHESERFKCRFQWNENIHDSETY